jgi:hypothetical protein
MKKTLIILAHPNIAESRLNKTLLQELNDNQNVNISSLPFSPCAIIVTFTNGGQALAVAILLAERWEAMI